LRASCSAGGPEASMGIADNLGSQQSRKGGERGGLGDDILTPPKRIFFRGWACIKAQGVFGYSLPMGSCTERQETRKQPVKPRGRDLPICRFAQIYIYSRGSCDFGRRGREDEQPLESGKGRSLVVFELLFVISLSRRWLLLDLSRELPSAESPRRRDAACPSLSA